MSDNLKLWNSVCKTDISFTKTEKIKGRSVTAIDPQYQLKNATEIFGSYGAGFGIVPGSVLVSYKKADTTELLMYDAVGFYVLDGVRSELPISACMKLSFITNAGKFFLDEDAQRKAETNAVSKMLSRIGFNSDVFEGKFEDKAYIDDIRAEQAIDKAEDKEKELRAQIEEIKQYMEKSIKDLQCDIPINAFKKIYKDRIDYLKKRSSLKHLNAACLYAIVEIDKIKNKRVEDEKLKNDK